MLRVSNLSGPVPRGLRLTFLVLTVVVVALAIAAAVKGVWALVVIAAVLALCNLGALWATRSTAGTPPQSAAPSDQS